MNDQLTSAPVEQTVKVSASIRKLEAERARRRADSIKRASKSSLETYAQFAKEAAERLVRAEELAAEEAKGWAEAISLLKAGRFKVETDSWDFRLEVKTTAKRLKDVYQAIGRLDEDKMEVDIEDAKKRLVRVTMPSVRFPKLKVSYVRKLAETDKCRIQAVEVPAKTEYQLVCERS